MQNIKAAARRWELWVEMQLFIASVAVIFSIDFIGPNILVVNKIIIWNHKASIPSSSYENHL